MGKGTLNIAYFHGSLSDLQKQCLVDAYKTALKEKRGTRKFLPTDWWRLNLSQFYAVSPNYYDYDSYGEGYADCNYTCSMVEISTPTDRNTLAKDIVEILRSGYKNIMCNVIGPNKLLDSMGFKLVQVFMGNHQKKVYSYQMRLDNLVM